LEAPLRVRLRLPFRDAQRGPLRTGKVLREKDNLADVIRGMRGRPIERLDHGERFVADVDGAFEIRGSEPIELAQHHLPRGVPARDELAARERLRLELRVAVAIRLLAVRRQELLKTRAEVAGD